MSKQSRKPLAIALVGAIAVAAGVLVWQQQQDLQEDAERDAALADRVKAAEEQRKKQAPAP